MGEVPSVLLADDDHEGRAVGPRGGQGTGRASMPLATWTLNMHQGRGAPISAPITAARCSARSSSSAAARARTSRRRASGRPDQDGSADAAASTARRASAGDAAATRAIGVPVNASAVSVPLGLRRHSASGNEQIAGRDGASRIGR
ncbi:hypothetical protein LUW76_45755 [Actinomadura madurae]|nr:hypothetical protein [Actinomadura madurae]URN01033.1 hypothetical protein LUW76_45755 [Actinomadura madurae]